ncbi:MAG: hypothetical protein LUG16_01025 [Candidatus Gastranaerophilales bacterium]|nr:hypothetical protein [Candidatus Gastranaerophilales bacterium]
MKINSITANTGSYPKQTGMDNSVKRREKQNYERHNLTQNNNDQISTTIKRNSDGRASFKGGEPLLHKAANFASYSPLVAEALFALFVTCSLRPLTIMATAKTEEDKEKCSYQAAKSVSTGLIGLAMSALIGTPVAKATKKAQQNGAFEIPPQIKEGTEKVVKKGVESLKTLKENLIQEGKDSNFVEQITELTKGDKLNLEVFKEAGKNAEKIFTGNIKEKAPEMADDVVNAIKQQTVINNYSRTSKNVMDKLFQPVFMPLRATITIALVPVILGLIGKKKPEKKQPVQQNINQYPDVFKGSREKELFEPFTSQKEVK